MADLTIEDSKYPPGKRISHPDFGDVHKTTYAKGVIKDFERPDVANPDDPIVVIPRVKVEVEGKGLSDFLPLFFHPKAKFWDAPVGPGVHEGSGSPGDMFNCLEGPDVLATAYNEEKQYFEKAWMSFRTDDEVAVMLKEGTPVAVLGFADGVPRVGEDIAKIAYNRVLGGAGTLYLQFSKLGITYPGGANGPDGVALGLAQKSEMVCDSGERTYSTHNDGPLPGMFDDQDNFGRYYEFLVPIGPILYVVGINCTWNHASGKTACECPAGWSFPLIPYDLWDYSTGWIVRATLYSKDLMEDARVIGATHSSLDVLPAPGAPGGWMDTVREDWIALGFVEQTYLEQNINNNEELDFGTITHHIRRVFAECWPTGEMFGETNPPTIVNADGIKSIESVEIRPHTKAELQAAGFLPA